MKLKMAVAVLVSALAASAMLAKGATPDPDESATTVIRFTQGDWEKERWTPVRLANQNEPVPFTQTDNGVGTTMKTFTSADYSSERDNAVMVYDLGSADAEIEITFSIGRGFNHYSAPGICIAPQIKDGVLESSIAVFVADYTMAIWWQDIAPNGKTVRYRHIAQLARWTDPGQPHVLRCRISAKEASVALKLDDSDVIVLTYVGNPSLSLVEKKLNSVVGLWGCHGECTFHEMKVRRPGTLPFLVRTPDPGVPDGTRP